MTLLYYCLIDKQLSIEAFTEKLNMLPDNQQQQIKKLRRWEDAHASLFGRLLLKQGLTDIGSTATLDDMNCNDFGKPYFENYPIRFNITHSGNFVACIISNDTSTIGIDAEVVKAVNTKDFKDLWSEEEWADIQSNDIAVFFKYWTRKEAVVKAIGKGLNIPLNQISVSNGAAKVAGEIYFLKAINISPQILINVASPNEISNMVIREFTAADM
jgi:4'-phosphopantetheinyl transferase